MTSNPHEELSSGLIEALESGFQTNFVSTWDDVIDPTGISGLNGLVLHASALDVIDEAWVAERYRAGLVIAGINIPVEELANLIDNPCLSNNEFAGEPYRTDFFISTYEVVIGDNLSESQQVIDNQHRICGSSTLSNISGAVSYASSRATSSLSSDEDYQVFVSIFKDHMSDVHETITTYYDGELNSPLGHSR
ncbi:MAG: hypothetical protein U0670_11040 [Anaerolineae bacterium]